MSEVSTTSTDAAVCSCLDVLPGERIKIHDSHCALAPTPARPRQIPTEMEEVLLFIRTTPRGELVQADLIAQTDAWSTTLCTQCGDTAEAAAHDVLQDLARGIQGCRDQWSRP